jgi:AraC-like DNA-binding protein
MYALGLTRAAIIFPIVDALEEIGAPVDRLLGKAGVPLWARTDPELLIPAWSVARLLAEGSRSQGIENLGLLAGQKARIETLGIFGCLIRHSRTLGEALQELVTDHPRFTSNGRMWLRPRGDQVEFCQVFMNKFDRSDIGWQQANHYILMLMLDVVRLGRHSTWRPTDVRLQTAESPVLRDAAPLAAARLRFGQPATAIALPRTLLAQPLSPPEVDLRMTGERIEAWRESAPSGDLVASIVQAIEMLSWEDYPDIHETAKFLGVSVRTLQRYLAEAGITHESLVGRARYATAAAVLEETDTKILDIALDLGYSDHAHFTRAFSRWAGCPPQEYRRRCRQRPVTSTPAAAAGPVRA